MININYVNADRHSRSIDGRQCGSIGNQNIFTTDKSNSSHGLPSLDYQDWNNHEGKSAGNSLGVRNFGVPMSSSDREYPVTVTYPCRAIDLA